MCKLETYDYKKLIVPLLHRMSNLEKLALYICVNEDTFIDGNSLKKDIINHLPQLNKFIFNIRSLIYIPHQTHFLLNEDIQHTLTGLGNNQIISYLDYFPKSKNGQCHFYSYPYTLDYYDGITNSFLGGLFKCVRKVELFDERPFEHEFFIRIQKSFPFLENLSVINRTPQKEKLNNNNEYISIIEYLHLDELDLCDINDDYVEQFLMDTKTCLTNKICLFIHYDCLKRVTHNFTRDTTRINCAKINYLRFYDRFQLAKCLTNYFPHAEISRY
jgi:hypothetical protein